MGVVGLIVLFVVFIIVYLMIAEVFVMLFRITGLTDEKARFQVISMLTNSGYTTKESELVLDNQKRRKLARLVMMFGYSFTVTIVSTVVNIFIQSRNSITGSIIAFVPIIFGMILISWFFKKNRWTNTLLNNIITKIASRLYYDKNTNPIIIIDKYGSMVMAKIELKMVPKELDGIELRESNIRSEYGINIVLKKTKKDGETLPRKDTRFNTGDTVVVMGSEKNIRDVFGIVKEDE